MHSVRSDGKTPFVDSFAGRTAAEPTNVRPTHRPRRSAAARRAQYERAEIRIVTKLLRGITSIDSYRGNRLSRVGQALRIALTEDVSQDSTRCNIMTPLCRHFARGRCTYGDSCRFSHEINNDSGDWYSGNDWYGSGDYYDERDQHQYDGSAHNDSNQYSNDYGHSQTDYCDARQDELLEHSGGDDLHNDADIQHETGETVEQQCGTIETAEQRHSHDVDNRDRTIDEDDHRDELLEEQLSAATPTATVDVIAETLEPTCSNLEVGTNCNDDDNTSEAPIGLGHADTSTAVETQRTESQIDGSVTPGGDHSAPLEQHAVQSKVEQSSNDPTLLGDLAACGDPILSGDPTASCGPTVACDPTASDDRSALVAGDQTASLVSADAPCAYIARSRRAKRLRSKQAWQPVDAQQAARDLDAMRSLELDKTCRLGSKSSSERWKPGLVANIETLDINATIELILADQDPAAVTMRQLRNQVEEWHGLPAEALASRKDEIKESATRFLNRRL